jgi:hypothetical protein
MCSSDVTACQNDLDCNLILVCLLCFGCTTPTCVQNCVELAGPIGQMLFNQLNQCENCACVQACSVPPGTCP